jgi:uncharacterized cupredoxin-like copper-binding protein
MRKYIGFVVALAVAVGIFAAVGSASTRTTKTTVVTVTMTNYHFRLSKTTGYKHGVTYIFKTINRGTALHNFDIQTVKATRVISQGKTASMTVTFKRAGSFQYICDVPRHAELGMAGKIRVS